MLGQVILDLFALQIAITVQCSAQRPIVCLKSAKLWIVFRTEVSTSEMRLPVQSQTGLIAVLPGTVRRPKASHNDSDVIVPDAALFSLVIACDHNADTGVKT